MVTLVQNLLYSGLLIDNIKIKMYRTIIMPVVYGCETQSVTLRVEHGLRVFHNRVLMISGSKRNDLTGN